MHPGMRRLGAGIVISIGVFGLLPALAHAGAGVWTSGGPYGGPVTAVVVDPSGSATVYLGTEGHGIFKSTDGGATWVAAQSGLGNPYVFTLALDPVTPGTVYAGTQEGFFKSTDSGGTWVSASTGLYANINAVAVAPGVLHVGTYVGGVFRSIDGGLSWTPTNTGLGSQNVWALVRDPATPATLYAGTSAGVFRSVNSGTVGPPSTPG